MAEEEWENAILDLNILSDHEKKPKDIPPEIVRNKIPSARSNEFSVSQEELPIDQALASALEQPRERLNVLKFEDRMVRFMKAPREQRLEFPPLSGFHRLLVHRLAIRFGLEHQALELSFSTLHTIVQGNSYDPVNRDLCPMVLTKTKHCEIPKNLLIDFVNSKTDVSSQSSNSPIHSSSGGKKIMLMKRDPRGKNQNLPIGSPAIRAKVLTVAEKEKDYYAARARIFGTTVDDGSSIISDESISTDITVGSLPSGAEKSLVTCQSSSLINIDRKKQLGDIQISTGPGSSGGFSAGRGKSSKNNNSGKVVSPSSDSKISSVRKSKTSINNDHSRDQDQHEKKKFSKEKERTSEKKVVNAGEWLKDGKVKARRRGENSSDPDFQRNYEVYRPNFAPYRDSSPPPSQSNQTNYQKAVISMNQWDGNQYYNQGSYGQVPSSPMYFHSSSTGYYPANQYVNINHQPQYLEEETDFYTKQLALQAAQQQTNYYSPQDISNYQRNIEQQYSMQPPQQQRQQQYRHSQIQNSPGRRMQNSSYNENFPTLS